MSAASLVIYLLDSPLSQRDYKRFGLGYLQSSYSVRVVIVDFSAFLKNDLAGGSQLVDVCTCLNIEYVDVADSSWFSEFEALLQGHDLFIIDFAVDSEDILLLKRKILSMGRSVRVSAGNIPQCGLSRFRNLLYRDWILYLKDRVMRDRSRITGGGVIYDDYYYSTSPPVSRVARRYTAIHNLDYDMVLGSQFAPGNGSILYLDQMYFGHPDKVLNRTVFRRYPQSRLAASSFILEVDGLLASLEALLKIEAVIQPHPRRSITEVEWGHRFSKKDLFCEVNNASLVVAHCSASIQVAVLLRKPVVFYVPRAVRGYINEYQIKCFAASLGKKAYTSVGSLCQNLNSEMNVDNQHYDEYVRKYVKLEGTPRRPFWEIVFNDLLGPPSLDFVK